MAQTNLESPTSSLELRFKRWTAVAVVCFLGLLAALPFRSTPSATGNVVAPSHRERSLRFRAEAASSPAPQRESQSRPASHEPAPKPQPASSPSVYQASQNLSDGHRESLVETPPSRDLPRQANAPQELPQACIARRGENLMDIAERALGDRRRWKELMALNPKHRSAFDELAEGEVIVVAEEK